VTAASDEAGSSSSSSTIISADNVKPKKAQSNLFSNASAPAISFVRDFAERLINGCKSIPTNYLESERLKKIRKLKGAESLTFTEYKFIERVGDDTSKLFRMLITLPFSPEFFFYSYLVFPIVQQTSNPWIWTNSYPSGFDSNPVDEQKRIDIVQKRRLQAVVKGLFTLKSETIEADAGAAKKLARERQLGMIERALKSPTLKEAIKECTPMLMSETGKKMTAMKMQLHDIPGSIVKDCLRSLGVDGLPNIPVVNRFNKGSVAQLFDRVRESDEFLATIGVTTLSASEVVVACRERCIRTGSRPEKAMREDLAQWLEITMEPVPFSRNSKAPVINDQHRRLAMMGLHATKDLRQSEFSAIYRTLCP
jgi:hypothetical protein